jgi:hypothetical protein
MVSPPLHVQFSRRALYRQEKTVCQALDEGGFQRVQAIQPRR